MIWTAVIGLRIMSSGRLSWTFLWTFMFLHKRM